MILEVLRGYAVRLFAFFPLFYHASNSSKLIRFYFTNSNTEETHKDLFRKPEWLEKYYQVRASRKCTNTRNKI